MRMLGNGRLPRDCVRRTHGEVFPDDRVVARRQESRVMRKDRQWADSDAGIVASRSGAPGHQPRHPRYSRDLCHCPLCLSNRRRGAEAVSGGVQAGSSLAIARSRSGGFLPGSVLQGYVPQPFKALRRVPLPELSVAAVSCNLFLGSHDWPLVPLTKRAQKRTVGACTARIVGASLHDTLRGQ